MEPVCDFPRPSLLPDGFPIFRALENDANVKIAIFIHILSGHTAADEAAASAPGKKEEVKQAAESVLAGIPAEVATANKMWRSAPRGKGTREALQLIKEEIERTEARQSEVQAAIDAGDYLAAQQKAQEINGKLKSLQSELQR